MKNRTVLAALLIGAIAVAGVVLVREVVSVRSETGQAARETPPAAVRVIPASRGLISDGLELTGTVEPYRIARLASPAEGPVVDVRVREGDLVGAGDSLLRIGRRDAVDALIASLQEDLAREEENLVRKRRLAESGLVSVEDLDQAETAFEKARAELVSAEEKAQDYAITAPWGGVVSQVIVKEGQFVAPRAPLLEMYDPVGLVIRAAVPERHAARIATGMPVRIRLDAHPDSILRGRIERVYPYLDPRLRTRTVEIVPGGSVSLLPGMFARLNVLLETAGDAVVVPAEAVLSGPEGNWVFVVKEGRASRRRVVTGIREGNRVQIVAGVDPGDSVVVAGSETLKEGAVVRLAVDGRAGKGESRGMPEPVAEPKAGAGEDRP